LSTNIELIAFDLGNVLCTVDETTPAKKLAEISGLSWKAAHEIAFGKQHKLLFEGGRTSFADHAKRAIAKLGITMSVGEFTDLYDTALIPAEGMFPLVSRIAGAHRIALVSNTSEPHWEYAKRFLPFSAQLDPVIVSYSVGSMKPEPEFYKSLLDRSGVPADRILFVDDLKVNIEAARATGMHGHVFTSMAAFEAALADLGVI
jgi:putative hydrolase of the HAD superfamily